VFVTLDAALVALDVGTGLPLWEVKLADNLEGYASTVAPLVVKDKVLVGITGGEFGARGFLHAYDAATGRRLWRWYSVPGPGEFGNETWLGDSWQRGGSPIWLTGSYDPESNLVYWTVGNPTRESIARHAGARQPVQRFCRRHRPDTGQRLALPVHAERRTRLDSCQDVVLVDRVWRGRMRKLLLHAVAMATSYARSHDRSVPIQYRLSIRTGTPTSARRAAIRCRDRLEPRGSF
jgi:hypothetical protein